MDKITRILLMYSRLIRGEKISKVSFCLETDSNPRSFDRDIEDIRIFFAEMFQLQEIIYDREENVYYLRGCKRQELELTEFEFLERVLLDSNILRRDEMEGLLKHLASNTRGIRSTIEQCNTQICNYLQPIHNKALLKIHGDIVSIINNQSVIEMNYQKMGGEMVQYNVIPCMLRCDLGYIYLIAYIENRREIYPAYFRLDRIYSFKVIRGQFRDEIEKVRVYLNEYAQGITEMFGGEFKEILLCCHVNYYSYVYDKFNNIEIIDDSRPYMKIRIRAFEKGAIKWIMGQSADMVYVIEPQSTLEIIKLEIQKMREKYILEA